MAMRKSINGFTIIELLIVIVVIGILAAITMVTYNGLQERAYAAKAAAIMDGYVKIFEMYRNDNGKYPLQGEVSDAICLGTAADFPASAPFNDNECAISTYDGSTYRDTVSESLNDLLSPYVSTMPASQLPVVSSTSNGEDFHIRGVIYYSQVYYTDDQPVPGGAWFIYYVKKDQDCPRGEKIYFGAAEEHNFDVTTCNIPLGFSFDDYY